MLLTYPNHYMVKKILPNTFELEFNGGKLYDDGEYNLRFSSSGFYTQPICI
jgi:hypothetical protein